MKQATKELINEWINKAEGDFEAAITLYESKRKKKVYYIIAFHCQQTIEKYIKALLICYKVDFPKIHDLIQLLNLLGGKDAFLAGIRDELSILNPFAIGFRYPGEDIELKELKQVVEAAKSLRKIFLKRLKEFV